MSYSSCVNQVELTGNSIYDYIHESDFAEMEGLLSYEENVQEPQLTDEGNLNLEFNKFLS